MKKHALFFFLYRTFLWPLLKNVFAFASIFNDKISQGLKMRNPQNGNPPWLTHLKAQRPIWLHCASGELEYAKPIIRLLKSRSPDLKILVTYFSPSVAKAAHSFPGIDAACPSPWDSEKIIKQFIDWHQPRALLIARTDTWPEMLRQAKLNQIPTLLFSATLAANSGRAKGLGKWISQAVFSCLDQIYCVSQDDYWVFQKLGAHNQTKVSGDTRFDQVIARLENPKPIRDDLFLGLNPNQILVAGSTWSEDEAVLIPAAASLSQHLRFVLVPHEPTQEHLLGLEEKIRGFGMKSMRYSTATAPGTGTGDWQAGVLLLVDKIGILAELYQKAGFAFVGGSFRKTVHSVMEPLAAGCITFVGPKIFNNREAIEFKNICAADKINCVEVISSSQDLVEKTMAALKINDFGRFASAIKKEIVLRSGKSEQVVQWCLQFIT